MVQLHDLPLSLTRTICGFLPHFSQFGFIAREQEFALRGGTGQRRQTFTRFKHFVEHEAGTSMAALLPLVNQQASLYRHWVERAGDGYADLSSAELSVYRLQAMDLELLKPVLIWLHEPGQHHPREVIARGVGLCESWIVRRALLRLPSADLGGVVADLISTHRPVDADELVGSVESYLRRLNSASTYRPGDTEGRGSLRSEAAYRRFKRGRFRVFLEAAEDHLRGFTESSPGRRPESPRRLPHRAPAPAEVGDTLAGG